MSPTPTGAKASASDAVVIDHEFKSHQSVFWPAAYGQKMFEYRRDDRGGYEIGQTVRLRLWHADIGYADVPPLDRRITNILRGGEFELPHSHCILGLAPISAALVSPAVVPESVRRADGNELWDAISASEVDFFAELKRQQEISGHISNLESVGRNQDANGICRKAVDAGIAALRTLLATPSVQADTPPAGGGAVEEALAEFQRRNGYHKPAIEELLTEFGELLLAKVSAAPEPAAGGGREKLRKLSEWATQGRCTAPRYDDPEGGAYLRIGNIQVAMGLSEEDADFIAGAVNYARSILSAPSQAETAGGDGWQPIETAPKEQQPILLALDSGRFGDIRRAPAVAFWSPKDQAWRYWYGEDFDIPAKPTHWRPLPAPPTPAPAGAEGGQG